MGRVGLFLLLLVWQGVFGENRIELDKICEPSLSGVVSCTDPVVDIACNSASSDRTGVIYSPGYFGPEGPFSAEEHKGTYQIRFRTVGDCAGIRYEFLLTNADFKLMYADDKLTLGNGPEVGQGGLLFSHNGNGGDNILAESGEQVSTKDGQFWLDLSVGTRGGVSFAINYTIQAKMMNETTLTVPKGNITSPGYSTSPTYPAPYEQHIIIDVPEDPDKAQQLRLTIKHLSLSGASGDYLLIGTGTELFQDPNAVLLSWNVSAGRKFIIDGTKAHLVFQSFDRETGDTNDVPKGYWILYETIGTIVTPPPPVTTTTPTPPVPDYTANSTILVDLKNKNIDWFNKTNPTMDDFRNRLAAVCNAYKPELATNVSAEDVKVLSIQPCYEGWYEDTTSNCMEIRTAVIKVDAVGNSVFLPSVLETAVDSHGRPHNIVLPSQLTDVYFYAILAAVGVIIIAVLLLALLWRVKLREYYKEQHDMFKVQTAKMEDELDHRNSSIKPLGALNTRGMNPWKRGIENPNFVFDEDTGDTALEYDPETGTAYPTSVFSWMNQPNSNFSKAPWMDDVNDSDTEIYSQATAPSIVSNSASVSSKAVSTSMGGPKRSILKKTNSDGTAYDMIPSTNDRAEKFVDVPLSGPSNNHVYDIPAAVQFLDVEGRGSIGETYL